MELKLIIVGIAFMLNPMISVLDVLPDFIGCVTVFYALTRLSSVSPELDTARPYFKYMAYVSVIRTICFFASGSFDDVMRLSVTLIFAVVEFGLAVMAFPALYDGIAYLNIRHSGNVKEAPEIKFVSMLFFGVRGFMSVLPQLGAVLNMSEDDVISSTDQLKNTWSAYTGLLTLVNIVITLICAVFFMTLVIGYIGKLSKEKAFSESVRAAYVQKKLDDPEFFIRRTIMFFCAVMSAAGIFLLDVIGDGVNIIPDFVFGAASVFAVFAGAKYISDAKKTFISGSVYTVLSVAGFFVFNWFMKRRFYAPFRFIVTKFIWEYVLVIAVALLEAFALAFYAKSLLKAMTRLIDEHSVREAPEGFIRTAEENVRLRKSLKIRLTVYVYALAVTALSTLLLNILLLPVPLYRIVHSIVNIAFVFISVMFFSSLSAAVKRKYERVTDIV